MRHPRVELFPYLLLCLLSPALAQPRTAALEGKVVYRGERASSTRVENTTDPDLCAPSQSLQDLLVDEEGGGLKNVILSLTGLPPSASSDESLSAARPTARSVSTGCPPAISFSRSGTSDSAAKSYRWHSKAGSFEESRSSILRPPGAEMNLYTPRQHDLYDGRFVLSAANVYQIGTLSDPPGWNHMGNDGTTARSVRRCQSSHAAARLLHPQSRGGRAQQSHP